MVTNNEETGKMTEQSIVLAQEPVPRAVTLFLEYLHVEKNYSPHTLSSYRSDIVQFLAFLRGHFESVEADLEKADVETIRLFLGELHDARIGKKSIARKLAAVRSFFKYLVRKKLLSANPAAH